MAKRSIRLGTVFHNACRTNGASHHGCNIDGYIAGNGACTPSHLNLHQSVHQRKRASTKNQIGVNSSVELTLAPGVIIAMEGDGCSSCWCRGLCLWCIKLTIWPLTMVAPASNRSVPPPFSPESVFTNGAMHASDLHMGGAVVLSYFLRDLQLDNGRSNFSF